LLIGCAVFITRVVMKAGSGEAVAVRAGATSD
jgi:hypothetical protein